MENIRHMKSVIILFSALAVVVLLGVCAMNAIQSEISTVLSDKPAVEFSTVAEQELASASIVIMDEAVPAAGPAAVPVSFIQSVIGTPVPGGIIED